MNRQQNISDQNPDSCGTACLMNSYFTCLLLGVLIFLSGSVRAQSEKSFPIRRVYVPENQPELWPDGDWQPISTARLIQAQNQSIPRMLQSRDGRVKQAAYEATYSDGKFIEGSMDLELAADEELAGWIRFGKPNLRIESMAWSNAVESNASERWGIDANDRFVIFADGNTRRLTGSWTSIGKKSGQTVEFSLRLMSATQSSFKLRVPENLQVNVKSITDVVTYVSEPISGIRTWTILGLEEEQVTFFVQPVPAQVAELHQINRSVQLINISASGAAFTSDFQLTPSQEPERSCLLWIPEEFQIQSVTLNLEDVSRRLIQVDGSSENGRSYRLNLLPGETSKATTLRVRGKIELTSDGRLATLLPKIMNEKSLEGEVNITIDAPYQVKSLSTTGLLQKSARFTDGTRDLWSYDVIDNSPEIKLQAIIPHAELKIDQIIHCREINDQLVIFQDMLWSPTAAGFYQAIFQLTNNFLVTDIQALNEFGEELQLNWTTERRNGKSHLIIDLANQISLRKPILVRISLKPRTPLDRQEQLSFPILTPVNGQIEKSLISSRSISITRTIPPGSEIKEAIDGSIYSQIKKMTAGLESNAWSENARIDDVSVINRFFVRRRHNEELAPMVVDELPSTQNQCELQTAIFEDQGQLFALHRLSVPPFLTQSMNTLEWIMPGQTSEILWKRCLSNSDSKVKPFSQSVQLYSNPSPSSHSSWTLLWDSEPSNSGFCFEAVVPIHSDEPVAIPKLLNSVPFSAQILNQATEFCELKRLSGKDHQQQEVVSELSYSNSDSLPEVIVHRIQYIESDHPVPTPLANSTWRAVLFCLPSVVNAGAIDCELQCQNLENGISARSMDLNFPQPIYLKSVLLNNTIFEINKRVSNYRLPELTDQLNNVSIRYSCDENNSIILPQTLIVPDQIQLIVCEGINSNLQVKPEFPFWKFANISANDLLTSPLLQRMQSFVDSGTHQIYESEIFIPDNEIIRLPRVKETISWKWIIWSFLMSCVLFYLLFATHCISIRMMLISAGILTFLVSLLPNWNAIVNFYPAICALLIIAQLAPALERWRLKSMTENPTKSSTETIHPLRALLMGRSLLAILIFLSLVNHASSQTEQASPQNPTQNRQGESIEDVLIPIPQTKLNTEFTGLTFEQFPAIVYVRNQYAEKLRTQFTVKQGKSDILFHAANYSLIPDGQGEFVIHCEFDLLEKGIEPLSRFVLPVSGISRISALRAEVNGQIVNMTPLPENQGLEIPLNATSLPTSEILQPENPFISGTFGRQSSPFRRYQISVDVLPEQINLTGLTRLTMNIPQSAKSTLSYPQSLKERLRLPNQISNPVSDLSTNVSDQDFFTVKLASIDQLTIEVDNISASGVLTTTTPLSVTELNTLLELHPQLIEFTWQLGCNVVENKSREFNLILPSNFVVQDIAGAKQIAINKIGKDSEDHLVTMEVSREIPGKAICVIRFLATLPVINRETLLNLPYLVENGSSRSTQLAVQTVVPGYDLTCQFTDAKASRMTQESFQSLWNETAAVQPSAQCFRVQNAQSIRVGLHPMPTQLKLQTDFVYQVEQKEILLNATYQGITSGGPIWSFHCNNDSGWNAVSAILVSDGQSNGVRLINDGTQFQFLFEQPIDENFSLKVNWKKRRNLKANEINSTPPRILSATSLTESARVINSISRTQWSLSKSGEQNSDPIDTKPLTFQWTNKQSFRDLPAYQLNKIEANTSFEQKSNDLPDGKNTQKENAQQFELQNLPEEKQSNEKFPEKSESTPPMLDHTIFQEGDLWNGETLVFWPAETIQREKLNSTIQIPANCEILALFPSEGLIVHQNSSSLQVETSGNVKATSLLIHWKSSRPTFAFTQYGIDLPTSTSAVKTSWRIINRNYTQCPPERLLKTWLDNIQILDLIGRQISSKNGNRNLLTPIPQDEVDEALSLSAEKPVELQNEVQASLNKADSPLHLGWSTIKGDSWTTQSLVMYRSVIVAGSDTTRITRVTAPNPKALNRWGLTLLTCIWGIGLVCYHATEHPVFRRRHLFVISLMMIGLMLVLLTTAST